MLYTALSLNILFLIIFLVVMISDRISIGISPDRISIFNLLWRIAGPCATIAGILIHSSLITILGMTGYVLYAFDVFMGWIVPSFSYTQLFTLRNIISGKASEIIKNMAQEQLTPVRKKITIIAIVLWVTAIATFVGTLIYYAQAFPAG